jgi:metal-responsive CopG/Arc/MetJ family transcriptional regulator
MSRIIICLPKELLIELDSFAKLNYSTRAETVRNAIRNLIKGKNDFQK